MTGRSQESGTAAVDPVTFSILSSAFVSLVDEMVGALQDACPGVHVAVAHVDVDAETPGALDQGDAVADHVEVAQAQEVHL